MAASTLPAKSRVCKNCNISFEFASPVGRGPETCSSECRAERSAKAKKTSRSLWRECSTENCLRKVRAKDTTKCNSCYNKDRISRSGICSVHKCNKQVTRVGAGMCEVHYYRLRRNKRLDLLPPNTKLMQSGGYTLARIPNHPLCRTGKSKNWVFEHRAIAYDKYGVSSLSCHWCGKDISWPKIDVDHLNCQKSDNRPENLVVTCSPCNRARGAMTPFMNRLLPSMVDDLLASFGINRTSP